MDCLGAFVHKKLVDNMHMSKRDCRYINEKKVPHNGFAVLRCQKDSKNDKLKRVIDNLISAKPALPHLSSL